VVGAGVTGLTTAIHLAETGHTVQLIAELPPKECTSASAGASWGPYLVDDPQIMRWTEVTRKALDDLATMVDSGVSLIYGLEVSEDAGEPPDWATTVPDYRPCTPAELAGMQERYRSGWRYTIPLVDMTAYLPYLQERLADAGGTVQFGRRVQSLAELRGTADVVVNCTGLGARRLVPDDTVFPTRGQLVVVENPGIQEFFQDNTHDPGDLTYILPHGRHVVLGGCATENRWDTAPDRATAAEIVARCVAIEPKLRDAAFVEDRVGLRPSRYRVRLEDTEEDGFRVIHNYGHGASGVSMSWGCAEEISQLIG
jgi:D-amino-acid oxidase